MSSIFEKQMDAAEKAFKKYDFEREIVRADNWVICPDGFVRRTIYFKNNTSTGWRFAVLFMVGDNPGEFTDEIDFVDLYPA